ncbi:PaaI family thioesterase [Candidatus Poribacteria bacterium]|nr:PaaI family thioesterase [Candidatus Poribacteria bacterium]
MEDKSGTNPMVEVFRAFVGKKLENAPPFTNWLDGRIVSCNPGEIEMTFKIRPEMANPTGLLHGGIQAAIIDDLIGMTAATLGEEGFMLTIDLHVNFIGKVEVGKTVTARARFIRSGRRIAHAVCEILDDQGNLVARGDSNLVKTGYVPDFRKKADNAG